jgi:hypothetical protein
MTIHKQVLLKKITDDDKMIIRYQHITKCNELSPGDTMVFRWKTVDCDKCKFHRTRKNEVSRAMHRLKEDLRKKKEAKSGT